MLAHSLSAKTNWFSFLKFRKMHKAMVFGLLLVFITFLAIKDGIGIKSCNPKNNAPVNSFDDDLIDEYVAIFIYCY